MAKSARKWLRVWLIFPTVSAFLVLQLTGIDLQAQDVSVICPCFSYAEVESIFLIGKNQTEDEGMIECSAENYAVECNAEISVLDQDYAVTAQARINWFDFDPGGCGYINTISDPLIERDVAWPHPAPEAVARACYNIIASVIAKLDSDGNCNTYP